MSTSTSVSVVTALLLLVFGGVMSTESTQFVMDEMCDVEESINRGCSKIVQGPRNLMDCARLCWPDRDCVGVSLGSQGECLHHQLCHSSVPCPDGPDAFKHRYMARFCVQGTWDSSSETCNCFLRTNGDRCNKYKAFCDDMLMFPEELQHDYGYYTIILDRTGDGKNALKTVCYVDKPANKTYVIWLYNRGTINFNREWKEYVNGFNLNDKIHWGGLRSGIVWTEAGLNKAEVIIQIGGGSLIAVYHNFKVQNGDNGYSFTGDYSHSYESKSPPDGLSVGDCLSPLQGAPFSTWDRDQDGSVGENCASLADSGWWYKGGNCDIPCNMMGWGLNNYEATPPRQRLTLLGVPVEEYLSEITYVYIRLQKG